MTAYDAAQYWVGQGIGVIPCGYKSKHPDCGALRSVGEWEKRNGKTVGVWRAYQDRLPTTNELKAWFTSKWRNIAIVTGWQNLVVFDFDSMPVYQLWSTWARHVGGDAAKLMSSYSVKTAKGLHKYAFVTSPPERTIKIYDDPDKPVKERQTIIDIKAAGGYCLADPSIHPSGTQYKADQSAIVTVDNLESVLPCIWLAEVERQLQPVATVLASYGPFDVIPDNASDAIKARYKVLDFFPDARLSSSDGRWYKTLCPLHDDKNVSGWIDTERNRYGCHTCIQGSIDVIEVYARLNGVGSKEAIREMV